MNMLLALLMLWTLYAVGVRNAVCRRRALLRFVELFVFVLGVGVLVPNR